MACASTTRLVKDPNATLDFIWDWSAWLGATDTIASHTFIAETGLTINSSSNTATTATVWLSGGTLAETYDVTCRITTTSGRTEDRTARIFVWDR